jgi:mono/diheme cytochrome c family protein
MKKALIGLTILGLAALPAAAAAKPAPTYSKEVAPIFYKHCTTCHQPGDIGPFSLLSYKDARPWVKSIREKVAAREMPPWQADPKHGKFLNDRSLSQQEIDTLLAWVDGGAKEGNKKDLPPPPQYAKGWTLGQPDAVFDMGEEYEVPAQGVIEYQHFITPTNFTEDKWVQIAEVQPTDRAHVHHVIVFVQAPPTYRAKSFGIQGRPEWRTPPEPPAVIRGQKVNRGRLGFFMAATAPGERGFVFPQGSAFRIPAGSNLVFQVHYTTNGKPGKDRSRVGLHFAKEAPQHELKTIGVQHGQFTIPAGEANHRVDSSGTFTEDVHIWALTPHMHMRGKAFEYRLVLPDGTSQTLLSVPRFDFAWQTQYALAEPVKAPKGSRLECTAWYDNSKANKYNPDPTKEVKWGDQTWEEMMIGFTTYSVDSQSPKAQASGGNY